MVHNCGAQGPESRSTPDLVGSTLTRIQESATLRCCPAVLDRLGQTAVDQLCRAIRCEQDV